MGEKREGATVGLGHSEWPLRRQRLKEWCYQVCNAAGVIALFRWLNRRRVAIVVYHAVSPAPRNDDPLQVSQGDFEAQIQALARHYTVVGLGPALGALDGAAVFPRPLAVVTFDDGYRTTIQRAAPILRAHGVPATVFVSCGLLGTGRPQWHDRTRRAIANFDRPELRLTLQRVTRIARIPNERSKRRAFTHCLLEWLKTLDDETREEAVRQIDEQAASRRSPVDEDEALMDWNDVLQAAGDGLEFGSHTVSHAILPTESSLRARWEIEESKRVLEQRLGHPVFAFCYPNGSYTREVLDMVMQAGYECALTVEPGLNDRGSDRYALRRVTPNAWEGPYTLLAKLSGFEGWLKRIMAVLRLRRSERRRFVEPWDRIIAPAGSTRRRRCECVWVPSSAIPTAGGPSACSKEERLAFGASGRIGLMHVVHTLLVGGMERLVVDLIEGLSPDRYDRYVCCLDQRGPLADELERHGVTVYCLNKGPGIRGGLPWEIRRLIRGLGIGVVHTHNLSGLLYGGLGAALARVRAIVHTEHGRELEYYHSPGLRGLERVLARLPNRVVAVSQPLLDELRYTQHLPLSRLMLVSNGVRLNRYRAEPSPDLRSRLGVEERDRVIGIIARLVPVKDHRTMLQAMAMVVGAIPEARLLVVGDGPLRGELEAEAARRGIASRVMFLGVRHDVPALLSLLEVFVLSSLSEGTSMTILEAMAAKCPVAATDVGGTSWLVHHEKTGLLVPSRDPDRLARAILRLLNDRAWAAQLGEAGYALVREKFRLEQVVRQYDALYRELFNS